MEKNILKLTLFVVSSPFQAICAFEAMSKFEIETYDFIVLLTPEDTRKEQICSFLDRNNIQYSIICIEKILVSQLYNIYYLISKKLNAKYNLFFIGDYYDLRHLLIPVILSKFNSKVIFLDDGASTINVLTEQRIYGRLYNLKRKVLCFFLTLKGNSHNTYFTIYDKIVKSKFNIIHNELNQFRNDHITSRSEFICIVGTNIKEYCTFYNITEEHYLSFFRKMLIDIKVRFKEIIYSPHGRCVNTDVINICSEFDVKVIFSSVSVEVDYLYKGIYPKLIIAFDSTALYTLKTIFPDSDFINYQLFLYNGEVNQFAENNAVYLHENFGIFTRRVFVNQ